MCDSVGFIGPCHWTGDSDLGGYVRGFMSGHLSRVSLRESGVEWPGIEPSTPKTPWPLVHYTLYAIHIAEESSIHNGKTVVATKTTKTINATVVVFGPKQQQLQHNSKALSAACSVINRLICTGWTENKHIYTKLCLYNFEFYLHSFSFQSTPTCKSVV